MIGANASPARGFTLVELTVVLTIAGILLAIGVPAMHGLVQTQRVSAAANDLLSAMNLARSEAIRRAGRVDMVPTDGANWSSGWVVFVDQDGDLAIDADEVVIHVRGALPTGVEVQSNMPPYLSYQGSGRTRRNEGAQSALFGTFVLKAGQEERRIVINMLGRARVCNPASELNAC